MYAGKLIADGPPAAIKAQLAGHLLEMTPIDFATARQLVTRLDGVLEVQTYGDRLRVFVDEVAPRQAQIEAALASAGIRHEGIREIEVSMEEAFISLIHRQTGDARPATSSGERGQDVQ